MLELFKSPPAEFRVVPLWIWNGALDADEIERQVREMHDKGVGGFVIHDSAESPREVRTRCIERAREVARRHGMHVCLDDEMPYHGDQGAGNKLGSSRAPSDACGCGDWTLSLEDMKQAADRQQSLGGSCPCPPAFYYSLSDVRTDAPPSQFYQATYWAHYKMFADYAARLSYALSQGRRIAQVALLHVASDCEAAEAYRSEYFDIYCSHLTNEHINYDIVDEESVRAADCIDQRLMLADQEYELLILPPITAIAYAAALKIKEFVEDGGKVMATMLLPTEDADGDGHEEVRGIFRELFGRDPLGLREDARMGIAPNHLSLDQNDDAFFFQAPQPSDLIPLLRVNVSKAIRPEVSVLWSGTECHDIAFAHRALGDSDIYFFTNSAREAREVQLSIRCERAPYTLDLETGQAVALPNCTQRGSRTLLLHRFEPCGSLMVYFGDEPALAVMLNAPGMEGEETGLSDIWNFELDGLNCLTLHDWNLNTVTHDGYVRCQHTTSFEVAAKPDRLLLVLADMPEVGSGCRAYVNGQEVTEKRPWVIDNSFQTLDIFGLAQDGVNEICVEADCDRRLGDFRLMGSFSLDEAHTKLMPPPTKLTTGSWADQGYPFYSGTGVYTQTVHIPEFLRGQRVILRAENPADIVEFVVNGASAGVRPWHPYELDITHLVKPGDNEITLKITNSLANMLLSQPRRSGLIGGASITVC